ncbi:MAG: hypothetical protein CM1200mP29_07460 [Verrucomicrobiota bacterium]|nr:MAG: hypothetical protein CM1200mP29_07460 [Verrucomicrobiota bacterium]
MVRDLEAIIYEYPNDIEAKAFLAVWIWQSAREGLPINSHGAVTSLIEDVLDVEPMHPCHHFRIHLWDNEKPARALASAARCGQGSSGIAHMWHMPGHIYSKLKRYHDSAWQQEASARVDHAHMMRDRVLPDQIHNFAHNNEWLTRNLNHLGRANDAWRSPRNMIELPRHPKYNSLAKPDAPTEYGKRGSARYGRTRLLETLLRYEMWDEIISASKDRLSRENHHPRGTSQALGRRWYGALRAWPRGKRHRDPGPKARRTQAAPRGHEARSRGQGRCGRPQR